MIKLLTYKLSSLRPIKMVAIKLKSEIIKKNEKEKC